MTPTPSTETALPREAYTLLAQANLLRMRGRWDEAVTACMAALRLAPESASAQSLLGDIYENQGRTDDAIQWYRMALDVSPDSPADRIKLDRLLDAKQQRLAAAQIPSENAPASGDFILPSSARRLTGGPERALRWGAWLVIALTVLVVVMTGATVSLHRPGKAPATITAPPVVVPDPAPTAPPTPDPPATPSPAGDAADPAEQTLLQTLQQDTQLTAQNVAPVGVQMDPRQNAVTLTILCPPSSDPSARTALLRDAVLALLSAGRAQGDRVPAWTVRCLLAPVGAGAAAAPPSLALVADVTPAALAALGSNPLSLSAAQLLPAFHNVWWSPAIGQ